eukprot:1175544-Prorocentrum_minimum.AAC.3
MRSVAGVETRLKLTASESRRFRTCAGGGVPREDSAGVPQLAVHRAAHREPPGRRQPLPAHGEGERGTKKQKKTLGLLAQGCYLHKSTLMCALGRLALTDTSPRMVIIRKGGENPVEW